MEWRINRCDDVARQLFDVGMKQFSSDIDFVLECVWLFTTEHTALFLITYRYTQFLDSTGCDDDARTQFEAVIGRYSHTGNRRVNMF